jgi:hypothetical protein
MADNRNNQTQYATSVALLPALIPPRAADPALANWISAVTRHLQVRQGGQGASNEFERGATMRDLANLRKEVGLAPVAPGSEPLLLLQTGGSYGSISFEQFAEKLRNTKLFKDVMKRLNDQTRFDDLPDIVRDILLTDLRTLAIDREAAIQRVDTVLQEAAQSLVVSNQEFTAALNNNVAGVRELITASANDLRATAAVVTQVVASLAVATGEDPATASVEQIMLAVADTVTGLLAQYTLKVNAGGAFAAIGLSATSSTAGVDDSYIIFVANNFAFVHPDDELGTGPGQIDPANPGAGRVPFGIDGSGTIFLNGQVRINSGAGPTLSDLAATTGVYITTTSEFFKVDGAGAAVNSTITLTANLTSGLSGFVTWTKSGAGTAPPTAGTVNTWTINAADQTDDANTYTATIVDGAITYEDSITIVRLRDG